MKNLIKITIILAFIFSISSCDKDDNEITTTTKTINGVVQKGPFISGSKITITELDENLIQTGRSFTAFIDNNKGEFELKDIELTSNYIELTVDGFFFNEITGELSNSQITLSAIADVSQKNTINVNILTHLLKERIKNQLNAGKDFSNANELSLTELLKVFYINESSNNPTEINIVSGDESSKILLAISSIILNDKTEAQLTEFLAKFIDDFKTDGIVSNSDIVRDISANSQNLFGKIETIKENITSRYTDLGQTITIGNFEYYIDLDGDGLVGADDNNNTDDIVFTSLENATEIDELYFSNEVTLSNITGNLNLSVYAYDDEFGYLAQGGAITEEDYNNLINDIGIISETNDFVYLNNGGRVIKNDPEAGKPVYWRASFYIYVNDIRITEEQIQNLRDGSETFTLNQGDKIKIGINPFHNFDIRRYEIGVPENCYDTNCLLEWAVGKTAKSAISLGVDKKEFSVSIKK